MSSQDSKSPPPANGAKPPAAPAATRGQRGHVLLAEDNPVSQRLAQRHLQSIGYAVDVAGDGQLAIAAFRRERYDLVLMGCQMPNIDGLEATRRIRKEAGRQVPILALTADVSQENHRLCLGAGMNAVLLKPITREELVAAVRQWIQRSRSV